MSARFRRHWLLIAIILLATFGVRTRLGASPVVMLRQPLSNFPTHVAQWTLTSQPALSADILDVLKANDYMISNFADARGYQAQLFVAYYRSQNAGDSMHSPKNCLPGAGWEPVLSDTIPLAAAGPGVDINRYVVSKDGNRDMVLYWYQAQEHVIASEYWGKIFLVWDAMRNGRRDGAIVRVLTPMGSNESIASATQRALSLANPSFPLLRKFLPQ